MNRRFRTRFVQYGIALCGVTLIAAMTPLGPTLRAQEPRTRQVGNVPREVSLEAVAVFNAPATRRVRGNYTMSERDTVRGDVVVLNGRAQIGGIITGQLFVVNGDATLQSTGRIDRALTVIGGSFESPDRPNVGGEIRVWSARLHYTEQADTLIADVDRPMFGRWTSWARDDANTSEREFFLTTAHTYNRVEGLPIYLGPRARVRNGDTGVEADLFGIFRTSGSVNWVPANRGYRVRLELRQGRRGGFFVGGRLFDEVDPIEQWQLSDHEIGISSFVVTRDYRDYWQRHGAEAYAGVFGPAKSELRFSLSSERWRSRTAQNVQSLFFHDIGWRANPLVDEGGMQVATVTGNLDTRNRPDDPRSGWLLHGELERGDGAIGVFGPTTVGVRAPVAGDVTYMRALVDVRRYNRLGPHAQFNARAVVGGWLSGDALPLERRFALSGIDALPGFGFRQMLGSTDTGACATGTNDNYRTLGRPAQCERMMLFQGEFKRDFSFDVGRHSTFTERKWWLDGFKAEGQWVLFSNTGRGWMVGTPLADVRYRSNEFPSIQTWRADVGGGFDFSNFGVYVAQAVSDRSLSPHFYVRLGRRF